MGCHQYQENHAIAVCKNCGRATRADRCGDTGQGIACCAACAEELLETYELRNRFKQSMGNGSSPPIPASALRYFLFDLI